LEGGGMDAVILHDAKGRTDLLRDELPPEGSE
jgi:hypothetical protein